MVHDKDVRLFGYPQYRPEFHLAFRVFINGLPCFSRTANHIHLWLNWTILNLRITSRKECLQFKSLKGEIIKEGDPLLLRIVLQKSKEEVGEIRKEEV